MVPDTPEIQINKDLPDNVRPLDKRYDLYGSLTLRAHQQVHMINLLNQTGSASESHGIPEPASSMPKRCHPPRLSFSYRGIYLNNNLNTGITIPKPFYDAVNL
jgi:hypothetical protein